MPVPGVPNDRMNGVTERCVRVPVAELVAGESPRLSGMDDAHVRLLARSGGELHPVVVHRKTMRVIDGMHRVLAVRLRGEDTVAARFFDGDLDDAFLFSVRANLTHGLPLTTADRVAAARRIIRSRPGWSDRLIATTTLLSARTVAKLRKHADVPQLPTRVGRDGRVRPLDATPGRRRAAELITTMPDASLRQIARLAGVAPGTVRKVRMGLRAGEDPLASAGRDHETTVGSLGNADPEPARLMLSLRHDPALRLAETGRQLLRLLSAHLMTTEQWRLLADSVPAHSARTVAELAQSCGNRWYEFAEQLNRAVCPATASGENRH